MEDKIKEAIELLQKNNYLVVKYKKSMEKDVDTCQKAGMECNECACHSCFFSIDD